MNRAGSGSCVPCTVKASPGKGLGVFVNAAVPSGATVWRHQPGQYEVLNEASLLALLAEGSNEEAIYELTHITGIEEFPDYMVRYLDEGALINHADQANVARKYAAESLPTLVVSSVEEAMKALNSERFDLVATRDLVAGEELLMDYNAEPDDPGYFDDACERFGVTWGWLEA
ncbi:MAG: SET domain-containing protein-lysine N-methyltransferase [Pseudomonadota bacterium]